jgi:hypothetical protein
VVDSIAARRILDGVLRVLPSCNTEGHAVEVIDAWVEGENILCVTYRAPWSVAFWAIGGQPGRLLTRPRMRSQWTSPTRWGSR